MTHVYVARNRKVYVLDWPKGLEVVASEFDGMEDHELAEVAVVVIDAVTDGVVVVDGDREVYGPWADAEDRELTGEVAALTDPADDDPALEELVDDAGDEDEAEATGTVRRSVWDELERVTQY